MASPVVQAALVGIHNDNGQHQHDHRLANQSGQPASGLTIKSLYLHTESKMPHRMPHKTDSSNHIEPENNQLGNIKHSGIHTRKNRLPQHKKYALNEQPVNPKGQQTAHRASDSAPPRPRPAHILPGVLLVGRSPLYPRT